MNHRTVTDSTNKFSVYICIALLFITDATNECDVFQNSMILVCWMEMYGQMVQLGGRMSANSVVVSMASASVTRSHRSALNCQSLAM